MLKPPTRPDTRPSALYLDDTASIRPMSPPRAAVAVPTGRPVAGVHR